MRRRVSASVVAAVFATGLLGTACGGGDESSGDALPGVDTGSSEAPGPAESEGDEAEDEADGDELPEDGIDRPEINLPDDVNNVFEKVDTDDPLELAVLADQEHAINAVDEAITSGDANRPAMTFYMADSALRNNYAYAVSMHEDSLSFGGTTVHYNQTVELQSDTAAVTTYCRDTAESYLIYLETGEQEPDPGTSYYTSRLQLNDDGVWQTVVMTADPEDPLCARD